MTIEAEWLTEQIALQLDWLKLPQAAALLRSQAVEIEHLKQDLQTEVACVAVKDAEIERLKSEAELFAKHTGLTLAAKDTLLRQALEAMQWEVGGEPLPTLMMASVAAIKQHLGEV